MSRPLISRVQEACRASRNFRSLADQLYPLGMEIEELPRMEREVVREVVLTRINIFKGRKNVRTQI